MLLASSSNQIKIYEYENFQKKFEYARAHNDVKISFVKLIPTSDESCKVISVLKNDIICILSNSLRLIRHYDPLKARSKYLARFPHKMEKLNYCDSRPDEHIGVVGNEMKMNADNLIKSMTKDYSNGTVTDVSISSDGNHLIVSFLDNFIMLCSTSLWDVRRLINFDGLFVKQCDFIPFTTAESPRHKMLLTLASNDDLMLMSIKDLNAKTLLNMNNSTNYVLATNGKILLNIQITGEILAFNMEQCLTEASKNVTNCVTENATMSNSDLVKNETHQWKVEIGKMQTKVIPAELFFNFFLSPCCIRNVITIGFPQTIRFYPVCHYYHRHHRENWKHIWFSLPCRVDEHDEHTNIKVDMKKEMLASHAKKMIVIWFFTISGKVFWRRMFRSLARVSQIEFFELLCSFLRMSILQAFPITFPFFSTSIDSDFYLI